MPDTLINHDKLTGFAVRCLTKIGMPQDDAQLLAESLVASNLRGIDSHGVVRLPHYATRLRNGSIKVKPTIAYVKTGPCTGIVDGGAGMGQLVAARAMREALSLAKEAGIGAVVARNSSHCGALAYFAQMASDAGMVGIAMTHADPIMVPTGMKRPFLGSNPMAFAAPGKDEPPILLDMATTNVPLGKIIVARQENKPIPGDWGVDKDGKPTTDPHALIGLVPFAGPKGYAVAVMIEVFCSMLGNVPFGTHMCGMYSELEKPRNLGHFMLAIDIARFVKVDEFRARVDAFTREVHAEAPADPARPPLVPGEPERLRSEARKKEGIPIGPGVLDDLNKLAKELGVEGL